MSPDGSIRAYENGVEFDALRHAKPKVEILVSKAIVLERKWSHGVAFIPGSPSGVHGLIQTLVLQGKALRQRGFAYRWWASPVVGFSPSPLFQGALLGLGANDAKRQSHKCMRIAPKIRLNKVQGLSLQNPIRQAVNIFSRQKQPAHSPQQLVVGRSLVGLRLFI